MDSEDTEDPCFRSSQPEGTLDSTRANGLGQKEDTALLLAQFCSSCLGPGSLLVRCTMYDSDPLAAAVT